MEGRDGIPLKSSTPHRAGLPLPAPMTAPWCSTKQLMLGTAGQKEPAMRPAQVRPDLVAALDKADPHIPASLIPAAAAAPRRPCRAMVHHRPVNASSSMSQFPPSLPCKPTLPGHALLDRGLQPEQRQLCGGTVALQRVVKMTHTGTSAAAGSGHQRGAPCAGLISGRAPG
ncbi:unnamed protein product [Boreogadus saida]